MASVIFPGVAMIFDKAFTLFGTTLDRVASSDHYELTVAGLFFIAIVAATVVLGEKPPKQKLATGTNTGTPVKAQNTVVDPLAFDRLIGMEKPKQEVQDFFDVMKTYSTNPELAKHYELKPPKGLLLYGPPGNGKTSFARACAKYYGFAFLNIKGSELVAGDGAVGLPQQRIKKLFTAARQRTPCIVFFDEVDAIAQTRSGRSINSPSDILLDSLLNEIDGFNPLQGVFIMAATNRMDILDPALIRPGRLEKHIEIGNPTFQDRVDILVAHLGKKPVEEDIDLYVLGSMTEGKSGAYLEAIVNRANTAAFRERRWITQDDLETAAQELK